MVPDPGPPQNRNSTDEQRPAVKRLRRRQVKWSFSPLSKYTSRAKTGGPSRDSGVSRERVNGTETNEDSPQTKRLLAIRREQTLLSLVGPPSLIDFWQTNESFPQLNVHGTNTSLMTGTIIDTDTCSPIENYNSTAIITEPKSDHVEINCNFKESSSKCSSNRGQFEGFEAYPYESNLDKMGLQPLKDHSNQNNNEIKPKVITKEIDFTNDRNIESVAPVVDFKDHTIPDLGDKDLAQKGHTLASSNFKFHPVHSKKLKNFNLQILEDSNQNFDNRNGKTQTLDIEDFCFPDKVSAQHRDSLTSLESFDLDALGDTDLDSDLHQISLESPPASIEPLYAFARLKIDLINETFEKKILTCRLLKCSHSWSPHQKSNVEVKIVLGGRWLDCDYTVNGQLNVVCPPSFFSDIFISKDGEYNETIQIKGLCREDWPLIVYNPDMLVSSTTVADAISCGRKGALSTLFQSASIDNRPTIHLVSGSVTHQVFEHCIEDANLISSKIDANISNLVLDAIRSNLLTILAAGCRTEGEVQDHVNRILKDFPRWCRRFVRDMPLSDENVIDEFNSPMSEISRKICLPRVYSLEQMFSCPLFGLKGKMDSIVQMRYFDGTPSPASKFDKISTFETHSNNTDKHCNSEPRLVSLIAPLELKTGRSTGSLEHRAQTLLYTLLLGENLRVSVRFGLLYYIANGELLRVAPKVGEFGDLIAIRNRIVSSVARFHNSLDRSNSVNFPPPTVITRVCTTCSQKTNCIALKSLETNHENFNIPSDISLDFSDDDLIDETFLHYSKPTEVCESEIKKKNDITGTCAIINSKSKTDHCDFIENRNFNRTICNSKKLGYEHKETSEDFGIKWLRLIGLEEADSVEKKMETNLKMKNSLDFVNLVTRGSSPEDELNIAFRFRCTFTLPTEIDFISGDPIVISMIESGASDPVDVAIGFVTSISGEFVHISCDRQFSTHLYPQMPKFDPDWNQTFDLKPTKRQFLLRRDELITGFMLLRTNVLQLLKKRNRRLASFIIGLEKPLFKSHQDLDCGQATMFSPDEDGWSVGSVSDLDNFDVCQNKKLDNSETFNDVEFDLDDVEIAQEAESSRFQPTSHPISALVVDFDQDNVVNLDYKTSIRSKNSENETNTVCLSLKNPVTGVESKLTRSELNIDNKNLGVPNPASRLTIDFKNFPEKLNLAPDQKAAIEHCLKAQDYALVLGMPGTGKSTTLMHLINCLVARGDRVLVVSYTNSAVDNLLIKVKESGFCSILRLGSGGKMHPSIRDLQLNTDSGLSGVKKQLSEARVVGTTCMASNAPILLCDVTNNTNFINENINDEENPWNPFDVCIIDEASQCTIPAIIGPLLIAKRFILCGDPYQLSPLVRSDGAKEGGMDISLFERLLKAHPESVATLNAQYRMCEEIQRIPNAIVYSGRLQCASVTVRDASMSLPNLAEFSCSLKVCSNAIHNCWRYQTVCPKSKVLFLDTDNVNPSTLTPTYSNKDIAKIGDEIHPNGTKLNGHIFDETGLPEEKVNTSFQNLGEAQIVGIVLSSMLAAGGDPSTVGVISPYKPQTALISEMIGSENSLIEVSTVDRFQGRDKHCIIVSLVRSNSDRNIGTILLDWKRLNVAFTRARCKLILVGSWNTVMESRLLDPLRNLFLSNESSWILKLPPDALSHQPTS